MLSERLSQRALDQGDQLALIYGDEAHTWRELDEQVRRLAGGLASIGVGRGDVAALLLPNCPMFPIALLALARIGARAITLDADLKTPEISAVADAAECRILIAADTLPDVCRALLEGGKARLALQVSREDFGTPSLARLAAESAADPVRAAPGDEAEYLYLPTSGTSGPPKLILRTQANLAALGSAYCATAGVSAADRILCAAPMSHGHGLCGGLLSSLFSGATLVLQQSFNRRRMLRSLSHDRITIVTAVPFLFSILAETPLSEAFSSIVRLGFTGGAPLHPDTWRKVRDRLGISLRQTYGSSETGVIAMNMDEDPETALESVGRPIVGVEVAIRSETGDPLPAGSEGEVVARSAAAAVWSLPVQPSARRVKLADRDGWVRTSDSGRFDGEGRLFVAGRRSHVLNIAGRKVNPLEIESVLLSHPKVKEAAVAPLRGQYGEDACKATVVCSEFCTLEELVSHCRERLADYKAPRIIEIRDALPKSIS